MFRRSLISTIAIVAFATPLAAQQPPPPPERLEKLRFERMQEALELTDEQMAAVRREMEAHRQRMREAHAARREAMQRLRSQLREEPVDQSRIRGALEELERQRAVLERRREELHRRLESELTPEQQAKFLLFNQRFGDRLRELIVRHRPPAPRARPGAPGVMRRPRDMDRMPNAFRGLDQREQIERIRERIAELESRLRELESGVD